MLVIGLCGGSGSGKGEVCRRFLNYGILSLDTDKIYRDLLSWRSDCFNELVCAFGEGILLPDGSLDRKRLASMVFCGVDAKEKKALLEKITHKHILNFVRAEIKKLAQSSERPPAVIVDAPLLYESGFDKECNLVIAVLCDKDIRISRIMKRDGITRKAAEERINSQISDEVLAQRADFTIINDGNFDLDAQVNEMANNMLRRR